MVEAWVQLHCLECEKRWEENPAELPATDERYQCSNCGAQGTLGEFLLTQQDLETVQGLQGGE